MLVCRFFRSLTTPCWLLLGGILALLLASPARGQDPRPRSEDAPVQALGAVATHAMPAMDNATLQARYPLPMGPGPLHFAEPLAVSLTPDRSGTWEQLDDGTRLWRLRVRSEGALSLSLGFTTYHMPPGGQLFLYAPDYESVRGPFTEDDNESHGQLWTPIIPGDEVIIEATVPAGQKPALQLTLGQMSHGFRSIRNTAQKAASGTCNIDVACEEADGWRDQVRAVARYTINGNTLCTGVLVNNTANDQTPYFLTANHCGIDPDDAASVVVYWNYEHSTCRSPSEDGGAGDGSLDQTTSGAIYRAGYSGPSPGIQGGPDFTLVELDDPIDFVYDVRFAGWSREPDPPVESVTIHHPQGQEKRISFDFDPSTITSYLEPDVTDVPSHIRIGNWDAGTTEPGSSGSPLFDTNQRIVGVLSGGYAACSSPTEDNDQPDWYGRFAVAWTGGGTPDTRLSDWLDPAGTDPMSINGMDLENDQTPPSAVTDLTIERISSDGITLTWTAPGDDGFFGRASEYEMRYSTAPIRNQTAFDTARVVSDVPPPQASGNTEQFTVRGLQNDMPYYFAIIARDNVNNASPLASTSNNAVILQNSFTVQAAYPNPFRTSTRVGFAVQESQRVQVDLYDALGRHVQHLYDDTPPTNSLQRLRIDANTIASGTYFVHIAGDTFRTTAKVVHVR